MNARTLVFLPAAALLLAGCMHHGGRMGGAGPGPAGGTGMMGGDMAQMCSMHRQMTAGKSPAEQQAAVQAHMRSMHGGNVGPQQVQAHMEMMDRQCAQVPASR